MIEVIDIEAALAALSRKRLRDINRTVGIPTGRNKHDSIRNLINWIIGGYTADYA